MALSTFGYIDNMRLYIGCTGVGIVVDIDDKSLNLTNCISYQHPDRLSNFGFAWFEDRLYAASDETGLIEYNHKLEVVSKYYDPNEYTKQSPWSGQKLPHFMATQNRVEPTILTQFDRPHQLLTINGRIYVTDTGHEQIRIFNPKDKTWFSPVVIQSLLKDKIVNWFNSINYIDNRLLFVAHNHSWSTLLAFDNDMNFVSATDDIGFTAHNIWKMHDKLWTLSSGEGRLQTIDQSTSINLGGFLRGVSLSEDFLIIGVNPIRTSATIAPGVKRPVRSKGAILGDSPTLGMAIFDAKTLEFLKFIDLPEKLLAVLDVKLLNERDYAIHVDEGNEILKIGEV
jgi:hypothetical protein